MKRPTIALLLLWSCFPCAVVLADEHDHYRDGMRAFKAGEYPLALKSFAAAADSGMRAPTLEYNIGVVHYKLGNLAEAHTSFTTLAADPDWGAIAHYNLGLIAEKQGNEKAAGVHYRTAVATTDSEKIQRLANAQLNQRVTTRSDRPDEDQWITYASVGTGYDDNVTLTDEVGIGAVSDQEDYFVESIGVASRFVTGNVNDGWRLDLGGYYRANADVDDFNIGSGSVGATYNRLLKRWHLQGGIKTDLQTVGGSQFASGVSLRFNAYRRFGPVGLRISEDLKFVDGAGDYAYLTGFQNRTKVELTRRLDRTRWRLAYEYEINDRDDLAFSDEFFSYSPSIHRAVVNVYYDFSNRLSGELRFDVRLSNYEDENIEVSLDETVEQTKRDESRLGATIRVTHRISDVWRLFGEYQYTDNDANFDRYAYSNNRYLFGIERAH